MPGYGEDNHSSKLKEADVEALLIRVRNGEKKADLAREYSHKCGVAVITVWRVISGMTWRRVRNRVFSDG